MHLGMGMRQAQARVVELLGEVGIPNPQLRMNSFPHEMSGGQQQRVMIAMAIACEPKLLIADEPTTALDVTIQKQILDLIAGLQEKHRMSVLFITHDLGVVGEIADRVVVMQDGEIREQGASEGDLRESAPPVHQGAARLPAAAGPAPAQAAGDRRLPEGRRPPEPRREEARHEPVGPDHPRGEEPRQDVLPEGGALRQARGARGARRELQAAARQDPGAGGRVGLGQDHRRAHPHAAARGHGGSGALRGARPAGAHRARDDGLPPAHPDHLPEPVREPEPALHRGPDPGRADAHPRHRQGRARARRHGLPPAAARRPRGCVVLQVPARILGRPAPDGSPSRAASP